MHPMVDRTPIEIPSKSRDLWLYLILIIPIKSAAIIAKTELAVLIWFVTPRVVPNVFDISIKSKLVRRLPVAVESRGNVRAANMRF